MKIYQKQPLMSIFDKSLFFTKIIAFYRIFARNIHIDSWKLKN
jgi:hypothetical protein